MTVIFLVDIGAHDGEAGFTLHVATEGYMSRPGDTPPNQHYESRLASAGSIERSMFSGGDGLSGGTTSGRSSVGVGNLTVLNGTPYDAADTIDAWRGYALRDVTIKRVATAKTSLAQAETLFIGRGDQIVSTRALDSLEITLHDRLDDLDKPLLLNRYAGTTTSSGLGIEGEADLKDKLKPKIWGTKNNAPCVPVNVYDLLYQVSDGAVASIIVYDGGLALTATSNHGSVAALVAATLVPGQFATCLTAGVFRLGGSAYGEVTADVVEGSSSAQRTAGQIASRILAWLQAGYPDTTVEFAAGTVAALDALNSAENGIHIDSDDTALNAIGRILNSVGAWILPTFSHASEFELGRLGSPSGTAVASFDLDDNIGGAPDLLSGGDDGRGIPAWKVVVMYDQLGVRQTGGQLLGAVTTERRAYLGDEWRQEEASDSAVLEQYPNATVITVESTLVSAAGAAAEASRLLSLHSVRNEIVHMKVNYDDAQACEIGTVIELRSRQGRLGLGSGVGEGRLYRTIGRRDNFDAGPSIDLELWGRVSG